MKSNYCLCIFWFKSIKIQNASKQDQMNYVQKPKPCSGQRERFPKIDKNITIDNTIPIVLSIVCYRP